MENIGEIRNYHEDSKHFRDKLTGPRVLEHANEPEKVKDYPGAPLVRLPASLNLESSLAGVIEGGAATRLSEPRELSRRRYRRP